MTCRTCWPIAGSVSRGCSPARATTVRPPRHSSPFSNRSEISRADQSKVNWQLLDAYDVPSLERGRVGIEKVDKEAANYLGKQRAMDQYVDSVAGNAAGDPMVDHAVVSLLGD